MNTASTSTASSDSSNKTGSGQPKSIVYRACNFAFYWIFTPIVQGFFYGIGYMSGAIFIRKLVLSASSELNKLLGTSFGINYKNYESKAAYRERVAYEKASADMTAVETVSAPIADTLQST